MAKFYKLTDKNGYTRRGRQNEVQWSEGFTLTLEEKKYPQLCTKDVVHAYRTPNLALLLNPIHASIINPILWEAEGEEVVSDWDKVGCSSLTTTKKLDYPDWYSDQDKRVKVQTTFAILCAEAVLKYYEKRVPDNDRPRRAIEAAKAYLVDPSKKAAKAAAKAANAAADVAAYAARDAAYVAAYAAYAANAATTYIAKAAALYFPAIADQAVEQIMEGP